MADSDILGNDFIAFLVLIHIYFDAKFVSLGSLEAEILIPTDYLCI